MRNYIILNGISSDTIPGLLISTLPPISKPKIRTTIEEIDGRDGDIVTKLGYSAYDKEFEIGLHDIYDINQVIAFFNGEGTIVFSNEDDKYYKYQILDQIDYEKLIRFKKAKVKMHVQPFKYPLEEEPIEIAYQYVNNEAEEMDLDNTAEAPMTIALKGNTYQDSTSGKNLLVYPYASTSSSPFTTNGVTWTDKGNGSININGTATGYSGFSISTNNQKLYVEPNTTYTLSGCDISKNVAFDCAEYNTNGELINNYSTIGNKTFTTAANSSFLNISIKRANNTAINNVTIYPQLEKGSTITSWEEYTGGIASPNPDYPQPIQIVSGDNSIKVEGRNVLPYPYYDTTKTQAGITFTDNGDGTITINGTSTNTANFLLMNIGATFPNGTYTFNLENGISGQCYIFRGSSGSGIAGSGYVTHTDTLENNTYGYFLIQIPSGKTFSNLVVKPIIQKGTSIGEYEPYKSASYPFTLPEGMFLGLMPNTNYQDYFYKDDGKWYLKKEIGKVVLNGSETWTNPASGGVYQYNTSFLSIALSTALSTHAKQKLINSNIVSSIGNNEFVLQTASGSTNSILYFRNDTITGNVTNWKSWLSSNNVSVYYVLATPTTIEITDETLIEQLNAIENAISYDEKTHITQNANDKPFILNATAMQKGSDTGIVDNEGNIYSKPTLDIEGSGNIGIYINGNQIFNVDLSDNEECIIDTTNLEAYDPTTNDLLNRKVTGNYSNFILEPGDNEVKATGDITKVTISNYMRWL